MAALPHQPQHEQCLEGGRVRNTAYATRYPIIYLAMPAIPSRHRRYGKEDRAYNPLCLPCLSCHRIFRNLSGLTKHTNTYHTRPHGHTLLIHKTAIVEEADHTNSDLDDGPQGEAPGNDPQMLQEGQLYHLVHPVLNGMSLPLSHQFLTGVSFDRAPLQFKWGILTRSQLFTTFSH